MAYMYGNEVQKSSNVLFATHKIHIILYPSTKREGLCQLFYLLSDLVMGRKAVFQSLSFGKKKKRGWEEGAEKQLLTPLLRRELERICMSTPISIG